MSLYRIRKDFETGNVCVTGLRGKGKDLLFGNVIARSKKPYIANLDYTQDKCFNPLDLAKLDLGGNTYANFISGDIKYYEYPYPLGTNIYISDVGVYYPSQYCNKLDRDYPYAPLFYALCRQTSECQIHCNVQNLNRGWTKLIEQSDTYYRCTHCYYIKHLNLVIQRVVRYDKYQSCVDRVEPCPFSVPLIGSREAKDRMRMYIDNFRVNYGDVKAYILVYHNKSKHDTHYFRKVLANGKKD